jgi:hypothetical protein
MKSTFAGFVILQLCIATQVSFGQTSFSNFGDSHRNYRPNLYRDASPGYLRSSYAWSEQPSTSSFYRSIVAGPSNSSPGASASSLHSSVYSGSGLQASGYIYSTPGPSRLAPVSSGVVQAPRYVYPGNFDPFTKRTRSAVYQPSPSP